jgi:serine/threonine-protein kinase RsbW
MASRDQDGVAAHSVNDDPFDGWTEAGIDPTKPRITQVYNHWLGGHHLRWQRAFPGHEQELSVLRRWLLSLLPEYPARDDVISVANELASNAIVHTASGQGGWFVVEISWPGEVVQVAVADSGAPGGPRMVDDPASEHGRGLLVVAGLSARTGACGGPEGRVVWAQIPWGGPGAAAPRPGPDPCETVAGAGQAALAGRFAGIPAWFGRSTLQWWALVRGGGTAR